MYLWTNLPCLYSLFQGICDEQVNVLAFVQQQHGSQIAYPLVREPGRRNQLQALQLKTHTHQEMLFWSLLNTLLIQFTPSHKLQCKAIKFSGTSTS